MKARWGILALVLLFAYLAAGAWHEIYLHELRRQPSNQSSGPVEYEGVTFEDHRSMMIYITEGKRNAFFPWAKPLYAVHAIAILAITAGFFGGLLRDIFRPYQDNGQQHRRSFLLGMLLGPGVVLVFVMLYPPTVYGERVNTLAICGVSLLAGSFHEKAWSFLRSAAEHTFQQRQRKDGEAS